MLNILLFGLALSGIGVAVWAHLRLGKVKKKKVVSTLQLMGDSQQSSYAPRRIVDWPLLALRTIMLLLVAFGFGKLLIDALGRQSAREYALIILDNSASMQAKGSSGSNFELAKKQALELVGGMSPNSRVCVLQSPSNDVQNGWLSPSQAKQVIEQTKQSNSANQLARSLQSAALRFSELSDDYPKKLYVLSDLQKNSLLDLDGTALNLPSNIEIELMQVIQPNLDNRGLRAVRKQAGLNDVTEIAFSDEGVGNINVQQNQQAANQIKLQGKPARHSYTAFAPKSEFMQVQAEFSDPDAILLDNRVYDSKAGSGKVRAVIWEPYALIADNMSPMQRRQYGNERGSKTAPRMPYEQTGYFLSCALDPSHGLGKQASGALEVVGFDATKLPQLEAFIEQHAAEGLLFMLPAEKNIAALAPILQKITENGGSVVLFAGQDFDAQAYQTALGTMMPVKAGKITQSERQPGIAEIAPNHRLFARLNEANRQEFARLPFIKRLECQAADGAEVLHAFADGGVFIAGKPHANGKVYFINTSADREWSDFPAIPQLFVPFVHLLSLDAMHDAQATALADVADCGQTLELQLGKKHASGEFEFAGKKIKCDENGNLLLRHDLPGINALKDASGKITHQLAFNFPSAESQLQYDNPGILRQKLESMSTNNPTQRSVAWENLSGGDLAWQLCLAVAAVLMLIEPVIANKRTN